MVQDEKVNLERRHVNQNRQGDETGDSGGPVSALITLRAQM